MFNFSSNRRADIHTRVLLGSSLAPPTLILTVSSELSLCFFLFIFTFFYYSDPAGWNRQGGEKLGGVAVLYNAG